MSDRMHPLSIDNLCRMVLDELKNKGSIFGIRKSSFYDPNKHPALHSFRFGQLLESPLGVAAGPQTQLSQNIIAAWLTGSRYIELKTIQILDELEVSKPCIDMEDEGFNCEWSQELKLEQSFNEYLNAWIMIHILRHKLKLTNKKHPEEFGTIFNMSAGYNLEGILQERVQTFFSKMQDASSFLKAAIEKIRPIYPEIDKIKISPYITNNITLSTMHGCPPHEIEKIASYLIETKKLHTIVKLNPTLNGPKDLRDILNNKLGFDNVIIPDIAFEHDLKYEDGIKIINVLLKKAKAQNLFFGLKLTNTLESVNNKPYFEKKNEMMYMSGRGLHALALNLATKLQKEFKGELNISFSSGADALNVSRVLECGLTPVTVSSDLLKPGGYERMYQYVKNIDAHAKKIKAKTVTEFPLIKARDKNFKKAVLKNLSLYKEEVLKDRRYHKDFFHFENIKTSRELTPFDCIKAPCTQTCPTNQEVPSYISLLAENKMSRALEIIRQNNPFPHSTGMACDHICQSKCSRINYDQPVLIRDLKRFIALQEKKPTSIKPKRKLKKSVAIIGGGPSGLSAAYFLALEGFKVEIFEQKEIVGGMLTHALPDFRAVKQKVELDIKRIKSLGITIHENSIITTPDQFNKVKKAFNYVYIATGAQATKSLDLEGENHPDIWDFLSFLEAVKLKKIKTVPKNVVVIGGGNSAIDTVRSAKRLAGKTSKVTLLYRRRIKDMPASFEEIEELLEEKIPVIELAAPKRLIFSGKKLKGIECQRMAIEEALDKTTKLTPIPNSTFIVSCDMIIKAIGQEVLGDLFNLKIQTGKKGNISTNDIHETTLENVFAGGDVANGPISIIQGIADGKEVACAIAKKEGIKIPEIKSYKKSLPIDKILDKRREKLSFTLLPKTPLAKRAGFLPIINPLTKKQAQEEAKRCLLCDEICNVCVSVCPNRANVSYQVKPAKFVLQNIEIKDGIVSYSDAFVREISQKYQTANIGDFCNECGNCATFCPTNGKPYITKPKVYLFEHSFHQEQHNAYFLDRKNGVVLYKDNSETISLKIDNKKKEILLTKKDTEIVLDANKLTVKFLANIGKNTTIGLDQVLSALILLKHF